MNLKLVGAALLALAVVATGAAAAAPGNAPVDVPIDDYDGQAGDAADARDERAGDAVANASDAPAAAGEQDDRRGPPADLPGQMPDFVGQLHDLIRQHMDGALDGILGDHVSDVTPDDGAGAADAGDGDAAGNATVA